MYRRNNNKRARIQNQRYKPPAHPEYDELYWDFLKTITEVTDPSSNMMVHHTDEITEQAFILMLQAFAKHLEEKREVPKDLPTPKIK